MAAALATLLADLQRLPLLDSVQRDQLADLQRQFPDPQALATELVRRGWLTSFQARQLTSGKGDELVFDQYVLLDLLGQGGMGAVYRAHQRRVKRNVALKVIRRDALITPGAIARFQREAETAAKLAHPNVVTLYDAHEANGTHFLVMEYLEGTDLGKQVEQQGPLPVDQACHCIRQAALGLQHAHEQGLVHRDIKPHNLMRTRTGVVKVMDLGLARTANAAAESAASAGLTGSGVLMGTADYLAPEQAQDAKHVDIRADIYSLGCTLYHLLAGYPPFAGGTLASKIAGHMFAQPRRIEELRPDVPPALGDVLRRMMAKKPEQRYPTPADVAQALAPFDQGATSPATAPPSAPPSSLTAPPGPDSMTETFNAQTCSPQTLADPGSTQTVPPAPPAPRRRRRWAMLAAPLVAALLLGGGFLLVTAFSRSAGTTSGPSAVALPTGTPPALSLDLGNGVTLDLVRIPAGTFRMGSPPRPTNGDPDPDDDEERPQHDVAISTAFYMGKYPVTQEQYQQITGDNPSYFSAKGDGKDRIGKLDPQRLPVERVSWRQAQDFCTRASALAKRRVDLPTEAEWEYACRAGTRTRYWSGDELSDKNANFEETVKHTTAVDAYPPNPWGLCDMHGNVWQWCSGGKRQYAAQSRTDPIGPEDNRARVLRGGSWVSPRKDCRCAARLRQEASFRDWYTGFRVVVRPE